MLDMHITDYCYKKEAFANKISLHYFIVSMETMNPYIFNNLNHALW